MQLPIDDLLRDLESPDRQARCRAATAIGASDDARAVGPLLRALDDRAADVRAKTAAALGRLRDTAAIPALIKAMRDDKVSVRTAAAAAIKKFGKRADQPLLDAYREASGPFRSALLTVLAQRKTPAVSELLIAALSAPEKELRLQAIRALGRRKDRRAVEPLLAALAEAKAAISRATRAWHEGQPHVVSTEWSETLPQLHAIVNALGEIRDERAFESLQELLELGEPRLHAGLVPDIVRALRTIDNARAVDLLHSMVDESKPGGGWLAMTLAGMDLMNATQALRGRAISKLWRALEAAGEAQRQLQSSERDEEAPDPEAMSRNATNVMRRLESALRSMTRGQG